MRTVDPGHLYYINVIDGSLGEHEILRFVKRVGPGYPGNEAPPYRGTQIQDVLRVLINRTQYLQGQIPYWINPVCIFLYRVALNLLEWRAARRHRRTFRLTWKIEKLPFDPVDGHIRY